jgi:hypothetical protein
MIYPSIPQDANESFQAYIDRLMKVKPQPFGGPFAQPQQQQGQDATASATGGLLTGIIANGGGGGGGSDFNGPYGSTAPSSSNPRGDFASADSVASLNDLAHSLQGSGRAFANVGNAVMGPLGMLAGLIPQGLSYAADRSWDSMNRGIDSDAAVRAEAMGLGGLGTYSDRNGYLGTVSNQSLIDAYDRATFGVTGSELSGGYAYGSDGSPASGYGSDSWSGGMDSYSGSSIDAGDRGE